MVDSLDAVLNWWKGGAIWGQMSVEMQWRMNKDGPSGSRRAKSAQIQKLQFHCWTLSADWCGASGTLLVSFLICILS